MTQRDKFDLEQLFDDARGAPPLMSDTARARVLEDALLYLPRPPVWRRALGAIGGRAGLGGLITATITGFWLGVMPPVDALDPLVLLGDAAATGEDELTALVGYNWYDEEG